MTNMYSIEKILKSSICAFSEVVYDCDTLEEGIFYRALDSYLLETDIDKSLETSTASSEYDIGNIKELINNTELKSKSYEYDTVIANCRKSFSDTIFKDRTINLEAFIDNLVKEFKRQRNKISLSQ